MEIIQKIKNHLNDNAKHFIQVSNVITEEAIDKTLYLSEIKSKYGDIDGYFKHLLSQGFEKLQIMLRKKQGNTSYPIGLALPLSLSPEKPKTDQSTPGLANANPQNYNTMHTGVEDLSKEILYKSRIQDLEERILEYKTQLHEKDTNYKAIQRKLDEAYDEIRVLKVAQSTAEKEKELALREAEVNRKSFFETEFAKTTGQGLIGLVSGVPPQAQQPGLNGSQLSKIKQNLIHWVSGDDITDEGCEILYQVATQMHLHHAEFTPKLKALIEEYKSKTN